MTKANKGKIFEDVIKKSFEKAQGVSIDRLRDAPKKMKNVDNPSDFIVYKYPHEIYVECKSHKGNTLPFSCIREEQLDGMFRKNVIDGVMAGIIVWYIDHDKTFWIPIVEVYNIRNIGAKSINIKDLTERNSIVIRGRKKRVYFDYDMEDFLKRLYEWRLYGC